MNNKYFEIVVPCKPELVELENQKIRITGSYYGFDITNKFIAEFFNLKETAVNNASSEIAYTVRDEQEFNIIKEIIIIYDIIWYCGLICEKEEGSKSCL